MSFLSHLLLSALVACHALLGIADLQPPTPIRVLALGDSLTEGYGVAQSQAYPALLQAQLHQSGLTSVQVVNAGIGGSTSASALSRIRWHLRAKPDLVILALGANDMLRGLPARSCERNLEQALDLLREQRISVILAGMRVPPNYGAQYRREFEAIYPRLERKFRISRIPFLLEGVAGTRELNQEDGIHPNEQGHAAIAKLVAPHVERWLKNRRRGNHAF